jgi:hypothetical protein
MTSYQGLTVIYQPLLGTDDFTVRVHVVTVTVSVVLLLTSQLVFTVSVSL